MPPPATPNSRFRRRPGRNRLRSHSLQAPSPPRLKSNRRCTGPVQLKREEQIAYMFLSAIEEIEHECQLDLQHACPLDQLLSGTYPKRGGIEHLKFDPNKADPNYTYTLAVNGMAWEAHATAKKPGMKGFCLCQEPLAPRPLRTATLDQPAGPARKWATVECQAIPSQLNNYEFDRRQGPQNSRGPGRLLFIGGV